MRSSDLNAATILEASLSGRFVDILWPAARHPHLATSATNADARYSCLTRSLRSIRGNPQCRKITT